MTSINELTQKILEFRDAREWKKYHTPKNLALSLIVEIGELFELIQWQSDNEIKEQKDRIKKQTEEEISDVAIYLFLLAHELGINLENAIPRKIEKNWLKYPVGSLSEDKIKWGKSEKD